MKFIYPHNKKFRQYLSKDNWENLSLPLQNNHCQQLLVYMHIEAYICMGKL